MRREISIRSLAVLAICLAVGSAAFCWRWTSRYKATIERHELEIAACRSKNIELEWHILDMTALLLNASEDPPRSKRIAAKDPKVANWCNDIRSSISLLRKFETARADLLLLWYHRQMLQHHPPSNGGYIPGPHPSTPRISSATQVASPARTQPAHPNAKRSHSSRPAAIDGNVESGAREPRARTVARNRVAPMVGSGS